MLKAKYINSVNEVFEFGINNNRINESAIRDYTWSYDSKYERVAVFYVGLSSRTITATLFNRAGKNGEMYTEAERLYAIVEKDVKTMNQGKLYVGDYYINAFIIGSSKKKYSNGVVIQLELTVLSDFIWRKEVTQMFNIGNEVPHNFLDYPYDYEYDYTLDYMGDRFFSDSITDFDFELVVQGPAINPTITVGDAVYRVLMDLDNGEYITINSVKKTVIYTNTSGQRANVFDLRDREYNIFRKMPVEGGVSIVDIPDEIGVSLTAFVERSEPKWT